MTSRRERFGIESGPKLGWIVNLAILLAGYWLRISSITSRSIWIDEAMEFMAASVPLSEINDALAPVNYQPPLFTALLNQWLSIGIDPLWLRMLPLLIGMLTLVGIMKLGTLVLGRTGGWVAGLITATLPVEIFYAQDLGEYTLAICLLTYSLLFLYLAHQRNQWRFWFGWGFFAALSVLTHYGMGITITASAIVVLIVNVAQKRRKAIIRQISAAAVYFIVGAPLLWFFISGQTIRIEESLGHAAPMESLFQEIERLLRGIQITFTFLLYGSSNSPVPPWIGTVLLAAAAVTLAVFYKKAPKLIIWWFLVSLGLYLVLVRTGLYVSAFGLRYSQLFTPMLIILFASAVLLLGRNVGKAAGVGLLVLSLGAALWAYPHPVNFFETVASEPWSPVEEMEPVFDYWWSSREQDEETYVYYGAGPAFRYYWLLKSQPDARTQPQLPEGCLESHLDRSCQPVSLHMGTWLRDLSDDEKITKISTEMGGWPQRMWMIFGHVHENEEEDILEAISQRYEVLESYQEVGASVYLLDAGQ